MAAAPESIAQFLQSKRIAVAGVSRGKQSAANPVFRKLRASGYDVVPVNPSATQVEGVVCYPDLGSIPGKLDGVVIATHPAMSLEIVRQAVQCGVPRIWFHRSFGLGSVSEEAVQECFKHGLRPIVGGCPLMFCRPVDFGHRCLRAWLGWRRRLPT